MNDLFIQSKQIIRKHEPVSKRSRKQLTNVYEMGRTKEEIGSIHQRAIEQYEEFKLISKLKPQNSREEASSLEINGKTRIYSLGKKEGRVKSIEGRPFNNAGKSVLNYK